MAALKPVFPWYGGKHYLVPKLLSLLPPHKVYVEVFGGAANLLLAKPPSPVEIYNDIDGDLVNFFRVLRDPRKFKKFYRRAVLTPYARGEWEFCAATFSECGDEVERAHRFYVAVCMGFSGLPNAGWSHTVSTSRRGMAATASRWLSRLEHLPEIHSRFMRVQVENLDFRELIPAYDSPETLFYLDPPYVPDTRREKSTYRYEMSLGDHEDLVSLLLKLKGAAVLSGYAHEVYGPLEEAGWQRHDFPVPCFAVGRTRATGIIGEGSAAAREQVRVESVWVSPRAAVRERSLFDALEGCFQ